MVGPPIAIGWRFSLLVQKCHLNLQVLKLILVRKTDPTVVFIISFISRVILRCPVVARSYCIQFYDLRQFYKI